MAQGGINASLGNAGEDSVAAHIANTLKSAQGLADEEAVHFMCTQAPNAVEWLDSIGVCFSRTPEGKIAQRTLGGASAKRACYAQDYTGLKILHTLYDRCNALGIEMLSEKYLLELLKDEAECVCGAKVLNIRSGEVEVYEAGAVIVATGGYSRIYGKFSTNSTASTGDGIAVAKRAGAKLKHMEFVQFHPTGLKNSSILISESARGEGGYVLNSRGERFTDELAPRDVLSRAINAEIAKGEEVFLDIRHLGEERINEGLPQERKLAKLYENVDPVESLIPIKPVAHYTMGGIEVGVKSQTNVSGLFACGECANHNVHGANRLGGNSLLEIVVFGREAGINAAKHALTLQTQRGQTQSSRELFAFEQTQEPELDFYRVRDEVATLFYEKVGIVRKKSELQMVQKRLQELKNSLPKMGVSDGSRIYNTNLIAFLEFVNMLEICQLVVEAALQRDVSVGAHYIV
jgi:succinate dehydrogenase / fumarate reductase flavoprotein subunit